jgi:hypothetical protein
MAPPHVRLHVYSTVYCMYVPYSMYIGMYDVYVQYTEYIRTCTSPRTSNKYCLPRGDDTRVHVYSMEMGTDLNT